MIIPFNEIIRNMYNSPEDSISIENSASSPNSVIMETIDVSDDMNTLLNSTKETIPNYTNLDTQPTKSETFTMDASFLYEDVQSQCMYPIVPPPTPSTPYQSQFPQHGGIGQYFNYHGLPYNYGSGYNFMPQSNHSFLYPNHVQQSTPNSIMNMSESSAFTPIRPKIFSPRLLSFETPGESHRPCQITPLLPHKAGPGRKKKTNGNIQQHPMSPSISVVSSSSPAQTVQLKEIQEIFSNTQIPIVSICFFIRK